jgi:translation elongation factor EF-Tu-like GTPase
MNPDPHIEAQVEFLTTQAGGRKGPAFSGYRPQFYYSGCDWDADQRYPDVEQGCPGDTVRALLTFLSPDAHWGNIDIGMPFLVREGTRTVAFGIVTKVFPRLKIDAEEATERRLERES